MHIIVDKSLKKLETNRSAMVDIAHVHYGQLNYPKKHKMCLTHGVVDDFATKLMEMLSSSSDMKVPQVQHDKVNKLYVTN